MHSSRHLLVVREKEARKLGVGIMLDNNATTAWREAVEVWKAVSSTIVMVRLK